MSNDCTAGRIFTWASIYGMIALLPNYFAEPRYAAMGDPISHPELLYGFVGAALALQLIYFTIGRDPQRHRWLMPIAVFAKLSFGVPVAILYALGRTEGLIFFFGLIDLALAAAFAWAWRLTRPHSG